jgi:hypothetical protein
MNNTTPVLFALLLSASAFAADPIKTPFYEETFNAAHGRLELRNGAALGIPGTGVSGKPTDRAYIGSPSTTENVPNGPTGVAIAPIAPDSMEAFTYTFWYYLDEQVPELQVPFTTASTMLLLTEKGFELRIENSTTSPRQYVFSPGINGPLAGWRDTQKWIFASFSWNRANNTCAVHQGTLQAAVTFMRTMTRPTPANATLPRIDIGRYPETIGNTYRNYDRPLAGRMDNFRVFDRVLNTVELEQIRKADLANESVKLN